ncbi:26S proteasome non-ATPase regulatory subunit 3 [Echinococcus granulosus]|uniref:26S proteasome regulatory subunit RPN3 n=1 Tax=Echinococcus granulosus TaxID=6210 RepID=W6U6K8_ECHGR|nr:26S proteasome non-ATPase regulatory subunit 3 [Echinococcus granulosus]EUB56878.1 26S proteasome non-ATPase regulatory subunit 3 [Echinococcus granulosus]
MGESSRDMRADLKSTQQPVSEELSADKVKVSVEGDAAKDVDLLTLEDIRDQIRYVEKAVATKELHFMTRVLRGIVPIRRKLNSNVLRGLIYTYFTPQSQQWNYFMEFLPEAMDAPPKLNVKPKSQKPGALLPEVEVYLHLLLLIHLLDSGNTKEATRCSTLLMERTQETGRRTMGALASRCFYYHSRAFELDDRLEEIRPFLHSRLRSATLKNNHDCQAVLINLLLRNYLHYNLHDQASKLVNRVEFPESAPNNEWARFLYYLGTSRLICGFIKAIQLDYNAAHDHLVSAHRKAPQQTASGFKQALHKLNTVVELLLGELPDRSIFRQEDLKDALHPYFQLTQAIHAGDLGRFNHVLKTYVQQFNHDKTYTLILRLRHNVIKTGVRRISLSYSKIFLTDVAAKLQLDSSEDAEYIVAKAIRDGVIEAVINRERGYMITTEASDLYSTREPMDQFNQRIRFCLGIRNQAIKAMRYPPKQYSKDLESAEERREREQQEMESAKELSEDDFDGFP